MPLVNGCIDDMLFSSVPNVQQTLLQNILLMSYLNDVISTQKTSCGAGHNKPCLLVRRSEKPKTAISLRSQSLRGSTRLPDDHSQTK